MQYFKDIELGGKVRRVNFSVIAVGEIFKDLEVDIVGLGKLIALKNHLLLIPTILYRGLKAHLDSEGKPVDFTKEIVVDWCMEKKDGVFDDGIQDVYISFIEAIYGYFPVLGRMQEELDNPTSDVKKN